MQSIRLSQMVDPIGAVVILSRDKNLGEVEHKAVETAARFLARQMEQ